MRKENAFYKIEKRGFMEKRHKTIRSQWEHYQLRGTYQFITHFYKAGNVYRMFLYIYNNLNTLGNTLENYSTVFQIK